MSANQFQRDRLPEPTAYYRDTAGLPLTGKGKWVTTRCEFHDGSDSMRIHTETGAFKCMAECGARGGDVLAYHRAARGLGFVEAARELGAYVDDGKLYTGSTRPSQPSARALLQLCSRDLMLCAVVLADTLNGTLTDADFGQR